MSNSNDEKRPGHPQSDSPVYKFSFNGGPKQNGPLTENKLVQQPKPQVKRIVSPPPPKKKG